MAAECRSERQPYHHEGDEGIDGLPLDGVVHGHHSGLRALVVVAQRALHLGRAYAVAADVDDVIHAPCMRAAWPPV